MRGRAVARVTAAVVVLGITLACAADPAALPEADASRGVPPTGSLTVGSVSLNPTREHEVFQPFADYLASRLAGRGVGRGRVVVVDSLHRMVGELEAGRVDLYLDSPFPVAFVAQRTGSVQVLLRRWKRGSESYRSIIFTRGDNGIEDLDGLRGRMVAFGAPFSTSAFLLPKAVFASSGLQLTAFQDANTPVPANQIGYVFSNDAENTMFWVLEGKVTAGAVNEDYYAELAGSRAGELRILTRSPRLPRNVVCARADLDPELVRMVVDLMLAMDENEDGRAVLRDFEETVRFDRFPEGPASAMAEVTSLLSYVEEDLGS